MSVAGLTSGDLRRFRFTAVLLLALFSHLLLMATPLHAAGLQPGTAELNEGMLDEQPASAVHLSAAVPHLHADHCAMEWSWPRHGELNPAVSAVALSSHLIPEAGQVLTPPVSQTHGPPLADRQALLQVFRM